MYTATREKVTHLLLIIGFGSLVYVNSFGNFFVWNDWPLIIENFLIKDWRSLPENFTSGFWKPLVAEPPQFYRPLVSISLLADHSLWALQPWGYHLTNTVVHMLNSVLVYFLLSHYTSPIAAWTAALLFATHPVHTGAVTYISGRGELLMGFFLLSGAVFFLQSARRRSGLLYFVSLSLFFLSLLAKETAVVFPLLLIVADCTAFLGLSPHPSGRLAMRQVGPLIVVGLYFLWREFLVAINPAPVQPVAPDFWHHLVLVLKAIPSYFGVLLYPVNLQFLRPLEPDTSRLDFQLFLSLLLLLGAGLALGNAVRTGKQALAFGLLWFVVSMSPVVHLAAMNLPYVEGWIYVPSIGFFLLVALALGWLLSRLPSPGHIGLVVCIAALLGTMTFYRNRDWRDEEQISLNTFESSPEDPLAMRLLGNARFRRARTVEAEELFQRALVLAPEEPRLYESMARLHIFLGKDSEALDAYLRMKDLTPGDPYPRWRIGRFHLKRKNLAQAERSLEQAVKLFPHSSELRNDLASAYYLQGKLDAAEVELEAALKISPYSPVLRSNLDRVRKKGSSLSPSSALD